MSETVTDDVKTLLGNPRKAIRSMAVPIAVSNIITSCNNVIDAVWLAGLGTAALAATGVTFPFFFMMMGIGNGIGIGASQAIARRIGAKDTEGTHRVASQAFFMMLAVSLSMAAVMTLLSPQLLLLGGAGEYLDESLQYAVPIFMTAPISMIGFVLSALLRAEGAAKRSMNMNILGAATNIVLDPIFIYVFGWGVAGAAWATVLSLSLSAAVGIYWYFVRKDTFVRIPLRRFRFDPALVRDILRVGIPASMEMAFVSAVSLVMNVIIEGVDPVNGIAVYTVGWRAMNMCMIPGIALGNAMVPVCAAAYGAKRFDKVKEAYVYGLKAGTAAMLVITLFILLAAPLMAVVFTYGQESAALREPLTVFYRICCVFMPFIALGFASTGLFQSLGMGMKSMVCTAGKSLIRLPVCLAVAGFGNMTYIYWSVAGAELFGALVSCAWAVLTVRAVMRSHSAVSGQGTA